MRTNGRLRRLVVLGFCSIVVAVGLTFSVGVIMLNNLVIKRSAELGTLDTTRKQLRTENALMSAEIAQLSAPPRVSLLARKKLGMSRSAEMSKFLFLDPDNRPITGRERARIARRAAAANAAERAPAGAQTTPEVSRAG